MCKFAAMIRTLAKNSILAALLPLFFLVALTACIDDRDDDADSTAKVKVGDRIPAFIVTTTDGIDIASASLSGHAYILNFFDTGCPDCQRVLPELQRIYDAYLAGVMVLNVPRSQTKDEIQAYWDKAGLTMPFYIPHDYNLYYQFATRGIPRTYVVDAQGRVFAAFCDSPTADFATLDSLLKKVNKQQ